MRGRELGGEMAQKGNRRGKKICRQIWGSTGQVEVSKKKKRRGERIERKQRRRKRRSFDKLSDET